MALVLDGLTNAPPPEDTPRGTPVAVALMGVAQVGENLFQGVLVVLVDGRVTDVVMPESMYLASRPQLDALLEPVAEGTQLGHSVLPSNARCIGQSCGVRFHAEVASRIIPPGAPLPS